MLAAYGGRAEVVRLLLEDGAEKNLAGAMMVASQQGHAEVVQLLMGACI